MKVLGGYFELELHAGVEYHPEALRLNTGRNAFEYILRARGYKKVYLPYFTCDVLLEPIKKLKLDFEFYHVNEQLEPIFDFNSVGKYETFLYTDYFGLKSEAVAKLSKLCPNLIVDNSQAFFEKPIDGIDTFYSSRKFFGLPDGAYLYTNSFLDLKLETDVSFPRFEHLLGRIDKTPEEFHSVFKENDHALKNQPIKNISNLTKRILLSIDYKFVADRRKKNFFALHDVLKSSNELHIDFPASSVPLVYPYLITSGNELKNTLIQHRIFVATYWPNVLNWCHPADIEYDLANNIVNIPIDQRICDSDINRILTYIFEI